MDSQNDIDLVEYMRIILKRKALIIAVTLLCLLIAVILTARQAPVYKASAELLVTQKQGVSSDQQVRDPYQAALLYEKMTKTFSELLKGRVVAEEVIARLGLDADADDVLKMVSAEPVEDTQLIKVTVNSSNANMAAEIANTFGIVLAERVSDIESSANPLVVIKVVEPATVPREPFSPRPFQNAIIAVMFGLILGVGLAFLSERLDTTVKASDELERLTGLTTLGLIPAISASAAIVTNSKTGSLVSEALRSLRTNIQYLNYDQSAKAIVVTSPSSMDGKTTLSANVAIMLARAGQKVLFVDCDLRRPKVHRIFKAPNERGLSSMLAGQAEGDMTLKIDDIEGLHVVTSGPIPPNPAELLGSERMKQFIKSARASYDFVILDTPPILAVTDAAVLAPNADGVLLASNFGKTTKESMLAAKAALERVGARILGFVINGVQPGKHYGLSYEGYPSSDSATPKIALSRPLLMLTLMALAVALISALAHAR